MTLPNFDKSLKQYAELAVDIGVAVKPGDTVYLQIAVDQAKLAQLIVAAAYDRGAAEVQVQWHDDLIKRLDMAHMATSPISLRVSLTTGSITMPNGLR